MEIMIKHKQNLTLISLIKAIQATGYGRAMFHPTVGLYLIYIPSAERPPQSWDMYPLRRNYSGSLTTISTNNHDNPMQLSFSSKYKGKEGDS